MKKVLFMNLFKLLLSFLWAYGIYKWFSAENVDFTWIWIVVGFPFGIKKITSIVLPINLFSLGLFVLGLMFAGFIGGFVLAFRICVYIKNIITAIIFWNVPVVEDNEY